MFLKALTDYMACYACVLSVPAIHIAETPGDAMGYAW